jgi:hypothetical protein
MLARSEAMLLQDGVFESARVETPHAPEVSSPHAPTLARSSRRADPPQVVLDGCPTLSCPTSPTLTTCEFPTSRALEDDEAPHCASLPPLPTLPDVANVAASVGAPGDPVFASSPPLLNFQVGGEFKNYFFAHQRLAERWFLFDNLLHVVHEITNNVWNFLNASFRVINFLMMARLCDLNLFLVAHPSLFDLIEKKGKG